MHAEHMIEQSSIAIIRYKQSLGAQKGRIAVWTSWSNDCSASTLPAIHEGCWHFKMILFDNSHVYFMGASKHHSMR
ncbi:hypothetical protein JYT23_01045 [Mariprofundus ferrooxydans]|nr:hypothetical protein [Mariprofundus ferrooxydans]